MHGHATSRLTPETTADTPARNHRAGESLPGPDAGHPLHVAGDHTADRPRLQFGLQFTAVQHRPGKADQGQGSSLNRSGQLRPELLMRLD